MVREDFKKEDEGILKKRPVNARQAPKWVKGIAKGNAP